jgi:hypothetical protein
VWCLHYWKGAHLHGWVFVAVSSFVCIPMGCDHALVVWIFVCAW